MANNRNNVGDLAFSPEEAAAIAQAEAAAGRPPALPQRQHPLLVAVLVLFSILLFAVLISPLLRDRPHNYAGEPRAPPSFDHAQPPLAASVVAITRRGVHFRRDPALSAESLGVIAPGQMVVVRERRLDGFHLVDYGSQQGYVAAAYLITIDNVIVVTKTFGRIGDISGLARLREQPHLAASVVDALPAGAPVSVLGFTEDGWVFVAADRYVGFVWGGLIAQCPVLPFEPKREGVDAVVVLGGRTLRPL